MSVTMLPKLNVAACKRYGRKLATTRAFTVAFGALVLEVCGSVCGLYEASDLLLGDPHTEKSDTVKWVDVSMPHKRSRRLKNNSLTGFG